MKRTVKLLVVILSILTLCACLSSCGDSDIPDGYQLVAREGDCFRLYVPTQGWMPNTSSGMTSAYFSVSNTTVGNAATSISVFAPADGEGKTAAEYWDICNAKYASELDSYKLISHKESSTRLDRQETLESIYTVSRRVGENKVTYKVLQLTAAYNGRAYMLLYSSPESDYDKYVTCMYGDPETEGDLGVVGFFRFDEPYESEDDERKYDGDIAVPDGMKIVSGKERPYWMFAPQSWAVDSTTQHTAVKHSDGSSVSGMMIMPGLEELTAQKYYENYLESVKATLTDFTSTQPKTQKISGIDGLVWEFSGKSGGDSFSFKQALVVKGEVVYVITYTALESNYAAHVADADKIIAEFRIK